MASFDRRTSLEKSIFLKEINLDRRVIKFNRFRSRTSGSIVLVQSLPGSIINQIIWSLKLGRGAFFTEIRDMGCEY